MHAEVEDFLNVAICQEAY